ncbi:MAG: hypothetical protein AAF513_04385 [Pseudomonadota bacterium]
MGLRSLVVPLVTIVLSIYMLLMFLNADYMRSMGAVDIQRNSAHLTYLMASGQSLWLFFGWAWVFAQIIVRDQSAALQEVVLAAPVPLHLTLMARFAGALVVALLMGASVFLGFLAAPLLVMVSALPPEAVGPAPWTAMGWALLLFTLPNALGTGALFLCAAIWTRSTAGPFAVAAAIALVWMVAMIVLRGGEVDIAAASVLDPSGYSEAERQSMLWTPIEKKTAIIAVSDWLFYNRLFWVGLPMALLGYVLLRLRREQLAIGGDSRNDRDDERSVGTHQSAGTQLPAITSPAWLRALGNEAIWQFKLIMSGFGVRLALVMLLISGAVGTWVNFVAHVDGPLVPTPQALLPFLTEFFYLIVIFMVVGFIGVLMRRDDRLGYDEWVDASPAPMAVLLIAKCLTALALIAVLCVIPALSSLVVTALDARASLDFGFPFAYMFVTTFPALAEVGALSILAHTVFRHAGTAYVVSVLIAFIAIINHEIAAVEYPPWELALPIHAHPSELSGWGPWLPMVSAMAVFKLGLFVLAVGLTWLCWRRGSALTGAERLRMAAGRLWGPAGAITASAVFLMAAMTSVFNTRLIQEGEFESKAQEIAGDIAWEQVWWSEASNFKLAGGQVEIELEPDLRRGTVDWELTGLVAQQLHGTLPHGVTLTKATTDAAAPAIEQDGDHFVLRLDGCEAGCALRLSLAINTQGWPVDNAPWLHGSGVWLRAKDVLPTLGHDPRRLVRSIGDRKAYGVPNARPAMPDRTALTAMQGVAPAGDWHWRVSTPGGRTWGADGQTATSLDFAFVWLPQAPEDLVQHDGIEVLVSPARHEQAAGFLADVTELQSCVSGELGLTPAVRTVVQAPRDLGDLAIHGNTLWAPEDKAWESAGTGLGGWQRQFNLGRAMARSALLDAYDLRAEHGAQWLVDGVAGWTAMRCLEARSGFEALVALRKLHADRLIEIFAESDDPITTTADANGEWLTRYATLALENWGAADATRTPAGLTVALSAAQDLPLLDALEHTLGRRDASALLAAPRAGDVAVVSAAGASTISAGRWIWAVNGWKQAAPPDRVLLRSTDAERQWLNVGAPGVVGSGLLIDADGLFERTVEDNRLVAAPVGDGSGPGGR